MGLFSQNGASEAMNMSDTTHTTTPVYDTTGAHALFNAARAHTDLAFLVEAKTTAAVALLHDVLAAATATGFTCHHMGDTPDHNEYAVHSTDTNVVRISAHEDGITIADKRMSGLGYDSAAGIWVGTEGRGNAATVVAEHLVKALLERAPAAAGA